MWTSGAGVVGAVACRAGIPGTGEDARSIETIPSCVFLGDGKCGRTTTPAEGAPKPPAAKIGTSSISRSEEPMLNALALRFLDSEGAPEDVIPDASDFGFRGVVPGAAVLVVPLLLALELFGPLDWLLDLASPSLSSISLNNRSERSWGVGASTVDDEGSMVGW